MAAGEQAARDQLLQCLAYRRPRHAELLGQRTFGRQALAGAQAALEDQGLDAVDDVVGEAALLQGGGFHGSFSEGRHALSVWSAAGI